HTFSATMQLIFSLGGLIVWYVGGHDVLAGTMSLGSMMAFLAYLAMFYTPLATLSQFTTWLTNFLTGCQRVFELLDTPLEVTEPAEPIDIATGRWSGEVSGVRCQVSEQDTTRDAHNLTPDTRYPTPSSRGRIRFDHVTFGYERHQPVLRDVNFEIRPGETIG